MTFFFFWLKHPFSFATEKAADDEVQKSDISSSSQGVIEKESLGPLLLEVGAQMFSLMLPGSCYCPKQSRGGRQWGVAGML